MTFGPNEVINTDLLFLIRADETRLESTVQLLYLTHPTPAHFDCAIKILTESNWRVYICYNDSKLRLWNKFRRRLCRQRCWALRCPGNGTLEVCILKFKICAVARMNQCSFSGVHVQSLSIVYTVCSVLHVTHNFFIYYSLRIIHNTITSLCLTEQRLRLS